MHPRHPDPAPTRPFARESTAAARVSEGSPSSAEAIRRDLLTLAGLPGQDRIRAIYGVARDAGSPSAA